jgi:hypothetical protein
MMPRPPHELNGDPAEFKQRRPFREPLSDDEVLDIYRSNGEAEEIGFQFNVDVRTVYDIKNHLTHIQLLEDFA